MAIQPRRVLFLVPYFTGGAGGAERVISHVLRHLDKTKFECHLARMQSGNSFVDDAPDGVVVHELGVARMRYSLPAIVRLTWSLRPETVLATVAYLNVMLMLAKPFLPRGIRLILREATTPSAFVAQDTPYPRLWRWFYRRLYPRADRIVCLSGSMLEDLARNFGVPRSKLVRIYNPVDTVGLRRSLAVQPNPYEGPGPHLVVAGRLRREKGVDILLEAMPAVVRRFPSAHLAVLGEGPQESDLRNQAMRLGLSGNVTFRGFEPNPTSYLGHADLFVLPSRFEGMPNALLEALALGTPAVATDSVGSMREIRQSAEDLLLVPPEDANALAEGIISVLERPPLDRCPAEASVQQLKNFDLQTVVSQYSSLF